MSEYGLHKSCVPPTVGSHVTVALPAPGGHSRVEDYWEEFNIASIAQEVTGGLYWGEFNIASIAQEVTGGLYWRNFTALDCTRFSNGWVWLAKHVNQISISRM